MLACAHFNTIHNRQEMEAFDKLDKMMQYAYTNTPQPQEIMKSRVVTGQNEKCQVEKHECLINSLIYRISKPNLEKLRVKQWLPEATEVCGEEMRKGGLKTGTKLYSDTRKKS